MGGTGDGDRGLRPPRDLRAGTGGCSAGHPSPEAASASPRSELGTAITFGVLYASVVFGVAAVEEHLGEGALYAVAALSGLTDVGAITLSTAHMAQAAASAPRRAGVSCSSER